MPPLFIFPHPLASVKKTVLRPTNPGCLFPILAPATSGPPAQRQRQNEGGLAISSDTPDPARFGLVSTAAPTRRDTIDRGSRQAAKHAKQKRKENPAYLSLFFALFLGGLCTFARKIGGAPAHYKIVELLFSRLSSLAIVRRAFSRRNCGFRGSAASRTGRTPASPGCRLDGFARRPTLSILGTGN